MSSSSPPPRYSNSSNATSGATTNGAISNDSNTAEGQQQLTEFSFRINNIRISAKQESRKNAFDILDKQLKVELVPKKLVIHDNVSKKRGVDSLLLDEENTQSGPAAENDGGAGRVVSTNGKRAKLAASANGNGDEVMGGTATPFEPSNAASESLTDDVQKGNENKKSNAASNSNKEEGVDDSSTIATKS